MTDHECKPGCMECDRALVYADKLEQCLLRMAEADGAAAEIRALHAQREALTQEVGKLTLQLLDERAKVQMLLDEVIRLRRAQTMPEDYPPSVVGLRRWLETR